MIVLYILAGAWFSAIVLLALLLWRMDRREKQERLAVRELLENAPWSAAVCTKEGDVVAVVHARTPEDIAPGILVALEVQGRQVLRHERAIAEARS